MEKYVMGKNESNSTVETFINWMNKDLSAEEARMVFGYIERRGYSANLDTDGEILVVDPKEPEIGIVAKGIEELLDRVNTWNCEFLQSDDIAGTLREQVVKDSVVLDELFQRVGSRNGYCIGTPTVKELISILSKLPEDYRVYNCGTDSYLYLWSSRKSITIDNESWLCC